MGKNGERISAVITTDRYEILELKREFAKYAHRNEYDQALSVLNQIEAKLDCSLPQNYKYVRAERIMISYHNNTEDWQCCLNRLWELLDIRFDWASECICEQKLSIEEMHIISSIALIYVEHQEEEKALKIYQLQIKQVVDYPRCRIYRQFIHRLIDDRSIRASGGSGLFYYTVLCSFANFRTSYRRIDGISYTVYPGEWVCTLKELSQWFRTRFQCQALSILGELQQRHLIDFSSLGRGNVIRYKIRNWARHNTVLEYNAPCQKDTGFFFLPVSIVTDLISSDRCSEMDIVLDLWVSAIYNDSQVQGSALGPVAYFRNGTGNPLVTYTELAARWGLSRATVGRILKKLSALDYISLMSFPGRHGSVIYLKNYLSTMFEISDVMVDKEEVAMTLNIRLELPAEGCVDQEEPPMEHEVIVSDELSSVSKSHIEIILQKMAQILMAQGFSCFGCSLSHYKLYPLSGDCREELLPRAREQTVLRLGLAVLCGNKQVASFELNQKRCGSGEQHYLRESQLDLSGH